MDTPLRNTHNTPLRNPYTQHSPNTQQYSHITTSPCTPPENRAAYIAHLNSSNTNFQHGLSNVKKITELEIGKWYLVTAFILKTNRDGKKYLTAKLYIDAASTSQEVYLPDRFTNTIAPQDNIHNIYMCYNGMKQSQSGFNYHDVTF